jgi:hypothetical protein
MWRLSLEMCFNRASLAGTLFLIRTIDWSEPVSGKPVRRVC